MNSMSIVIYECPVFVFGKLYSGMNSNENTYGKVVYCCSSMCSVVLEYSLSLERHWLFVLNYGS